MEGRVALLQELFLGAADTTGERHGCSHEGGPREHFRSVPRLAAERER